MGVPESYFRAPDEAMWAEQWSLTSAGHGRTEYESFVRAAVEAATTPNGVTGVRVMWGTMERIVTGLRAAYSDHVSPDRQLLARAFGVNLKFLHLRRKDRVGQAISWARAEQTGYWHPGDQRSGEPRYDFERIDHLVRTIRLHEAAWQTWFEQVGANAHEVEYERLVASPAVFVSEVADYLGVALAVGRPAMASDRRQADLTNIDWAIRYRSDGGRA